MAIFDMLDKIDDIIYEPIKLMTDWAREPLRRREHEREKEKQEHSKTIDANLAIKKKTEVQRILTEIDELRKDKDFQRMKAVSDAIMQYQKDLTHLNIDAINAIGQMQLNLRERAQDLVYDKTIKYKELQDKAHHQAIDEIEEIEKRFHNNEAAKAMFYKSVDHRLANIISTAHKFLIELNNDIAVLNESIRTLTESGQNFIEGHLEKFHVNNNILLENSAKPKALTGERTT